MAAIDKAFTGSIPETYERYLVPLIFESYAQDMAERVKIAQAARHPRNGCRHRGRHTSYVKDAPNFGAPAEIASVPPESGDWHASLRVNILAGARCRSASLLIASWCRSPCR
jgi:hypothetical protein